MLTLTLSILGPPMEGVGLPPAVDPVLDMIRTATNVVGQAPVPVLVPAREGLLEPRRVRPGRRFTGGRAAAGGRRRLTGRLLTWAARTVR